MKPPKPSRCDHPARINARFCGECGLAIAASQICQHCGSDQPTHHRFCDSCGRALEYGTLPARPAHTPSAGWSASWGLVYAGAVVAAGGQFILSSATGGEPPRSGVIALFAGALLFGVGTVRAGAYPPSYEPGELSHRQQVPGYARAFGIAGGFLMLALLANLAVGSVSGWDLVPWIASLALVGVALGAATRWPSLRQVRQYRPDLAINLAIVSVYLLVNVPDTLHWHYSAIGDEYAEYWLARDLLIHGVSKPFSHSGVYSSVPMMDSIYTSLAMAPFGIGHFGWIAANYLTMMLSIPALYAIGWMMAGRGAATVAASAFAFSHFVFGWSHLGHNNLASYTPTIWALAFFLSGIRRGSVPLLYVAGVSAGLGVYSNFFARATIPIMALFLVTQPSLFRPGSWRRMFHGWPVMLGFVLSVAPILVVSSDEIYRQTIRLVAGGYSTDVSGPPLERIASNLMINGLAFNFSTKTTHFVSGSLLDPVSAVLAVLGLGFALSRPRLESLRLMTCWLAVAFVGTGLLSPYPTVVITRLHFVIPPLALLIGLSAHHLWIGLPKVDRGGVPRVLAAAATSVLCLLILALNVQRFWYVAPRTMQLTQEAVAIGALRSDLCVADLGRAVVIMQKTYPLLRPALESYAPNGPQPRLIDTADLKPEELLVTAGFDCIVFGQPIEAAASELIEQLRRRYPQVGLRPFTEPSQRSMVLVWSTEAAR